MNMKLYYSVCENYDGEVGVHSFGGNSLAEEKSYAKEGMKRVYLVTASWDAAWARCGKERAKKSNVSPATRGGQGEPTTPIE